MADSIDFIFYINLEKRADRREQIETELKKMEITAERFVGIPFEPGIVGCGKSHLEVLKLAKDRKYKNVLILEDDFTFLVNRENFDNCLNKFFNDTEGNYDVCMFCSQDLEEKGEKPFSYLSSVFHAKNASAYLVNGTYLDTIIKLYEWAIPLLESTGEIEKYSNDEAWKLLQEKDKWFVFNPRLGKQRPGYSDNEKKFIDYDL